MDNNIKQLINGYERWLCNHINKSFLEKNIKKTEIKAKFAVQISGGLRHFKYTIPWLNHFIIEPLDADVFVHGWANTEGITENEKQLNQYKNLKSYKVNDITNDDFSFLRDSNKNIEKVNGNVYSCNLLRQKYEIENNINYDIVIRCRPDAFFFSEFEDEDIRKLLENNCIGIPINYFGKLWCPYITDMFAFGKAEIMNRYSQAYLYITESIKFRGIGPEDSVDYHIKQNMQDVFVHNIDPTFIIDYPSDYNSEELYNINTRFNGEANTKGNQWSY